MKKILLAFSDPLLVAVLADMLDEHQCDCVVVHSATDFVEVCNKGGYDCIVTSFSEPFLSGHDLASKIREVSFPLKPSIFLVSQYHSESILVSLFESGVDQYLTMPLDVRSITRKILAKA